MNRSQFLRNSIRWTTAVVASLWAGKSFAQTQPAAPTCDKKLEQAQFDSAFVNNWLTDLFDAIDTEVDSKTKMKLLEACGRGCYRRFPFKQEIAKKGAGNVDSLIQAYKENFEAWREGNLVHIRYGETSKGCYCPAAKNRPARPNDLHCECTRTAHQTIFETALSRHVQVDIVESVRRGGKTCHFVAHV